MASQDYINFMNNEARKKFLALTQQQEKEIIRIYRTAGLRLASKYEKSKEGSATRAFYSSYTKQLNEQMNELMMKYNLDVSAIHTNTNAQILNEAMQGAGLIGVNTNKVMQGIRFESLSAFLDGGIYKDGKGLSERIWGTAVENGTNLQRIILSGVMTGTSASELSKMLEQYVDPKARLTWDRDKIKSILGDGYANWNKNLEYNALRLARTTLTHGIQVNQMNSCSKNPYVEGLKWHLSASHSARMRGRTDICDERNGKTFPVMECPFDHPNGLCYQTPAIPKTLDEIGDELVDWVKGGNNPTLDKWWQENGGNLLTNDAKPTIKQGNGTFKTISTTEDYVKGVYKIEGKTITAKIPIGEQSMVQEFYDATTIKQKDDIITYYYDCLTTEYNKTKYKELQGVAKYLEKINSATVEGKPKLDMAVDNGENILYNNINRVFRTIQSRAEAEKWSVDEFRGWLNTLTTTERDALNRYSGHWYSEMNDHLRKGDNASEKARDFIVHCKRALNKSVVPEDIIVYRGAGYSALGDIPLSQLEGAIIEDKGFMSTSVLKSSSFKRDVSFEILVPKGYKGAGMITELSNFKTEYELLFKPNTKLLVHSVEKGEYTLNLKCEVIS